MKFTKVLLVHLEAQGCTVKDTSKGWMVRMPNGGQVSLHKTPSDHRAMLNIRSIVLRAGLTWPGEKTKRKVA